MDKKVLEAAARAIQEAGSAVITTHVQPDGDAFGSLLALTRYLKQCGKEVCPTWGEEIKVPGHYRWMPGIDEIVDPNNCTGGDILIAVDCANEHRLGQLESLLPGFKTVINIDHHVDNSGFGTINVLDFNAGAACEIVFDLMKVLGAEIDPEVADMLYTGIVTDTGRFQYSNTTAKTLRSAAELMDRGAQPTKIFREIYESVPFAALKLLGLILDRAVLLEKSDFVYSYVLEEDLEQAHSSMGDTENFIDYLRTAREANVAAIFKQTVEGTLRVSMRSKGAIDVGAICREAGGGGHRNAAGATLDMSIDEAVAWISQRILSQRTASAAG